MFEEGREIERGESEGAVWVQGHASTVPASDVDKRSAGETGASLEAEESSKFQQALGTRGSFLRQPESDLRDEQLLPALSQTGPQRPHPPSSLLPRLLATTRASSPPTLNHWVAHEQDHIRDNYQDLEQDIGHPLSEVYLPMQH